jgi:hypothetical protein
MQFSPSSNYFIPLQSKYPPQHLVLNTVNLYSCLILQIKFHTHTKVKENFCVC